MLGRANLASMYEQEFLSKRMKQQSGNLVGSDREGRTGTCFCCTCTVVETDVRVGY